MAILEIGGKRVQVDDSFLSLSPEDQNRAVEEIAGQIGATAQNQQPDVSSGGWGETIGRGLLDMGNQAVAGVNEGIAALAGAPVDLATGAINLGIAGTNAALGSSIPQITDPFGGGEDMQAIMSPFVTAEAPQDALGRYSRSVGRDIGASIVPVGATLGTAKNIASPIVAALESSVGSGVASQAARDIAPNSPLLEILAGVAGGAAPLALNRAAKAVVPTKEALRTEAGSLYEAGRVRPAASAQSVSDLRSAADAVLRENSRITPAGRVVASGNVKSFLDVLDDYKGQSMTPGEMQNMRSFLQDAAKSTDAGERRIGSILLDKFDEWRNQHVPEFAQADSLYGRAKRAEDVDFRIEKADRRAASSGTGGNAVNAARQNIRQILDNPKAKRGYASDEIAAMEDIVRGTPTVNAARLLGRLSPTSGAIPLMGFGVASGAAGPLGAVPSAIGYFSKAASEAMTSRQIDSLSELIRNGAPVAKPAMTEAQSAIVRALLGSVIADEPGN